MNKPVLKLSNVRLDFYK